MADIVFTDVSQKTWIAEGAGLYSGFKLATRENLWLIEVLKKRFAGLGRGALVLDVGGRSGQISYGIQGREFVHIVDPDPTLALDEAPGRFWRSKIQDTDLEGNSYKVIICSHVLGYLGKEDAQRDTLRKLTDSLALGGTMVLFYNRNTRYMARLLRFATERLEQLHYDYLEPGSLDRYGAPRFRVTHVDVSFELTCPTFQELGRNCWFLFGTIDQDIEETARLFQPRLTSDLEVPVFGVDERVTFVERLQ